jgi:hypothetical protein
MRHSLGKGKRAMELKERERGRHLYKNSMEEERERSLCWEHATLSRWMKRERGRHLYKNRSGRKREKTRPLQEASDTPK